MSTKDGRQVQVRNGLWADATAAVPFALWRTHATVPLEAHQCLHVSGAVVATTSDGQPKLTSGRLTHISVSTFLILYTSADTTVPSSFSYP